MYDRTLWGRASATNVQKVLWALDELDLAYQHVPLGGSHGGLDTVEYKALNPNGRVPTLRDADIVIWESHAILRYLSASYGEGGLWPRSATARAAVDQWTDWTATRFQPAWMAVFWAVVRTPRAMHDTEAIDTALVEALRCVQILDAALAGRSFLTGEMLSYADIAAGVAAYRWFEMPIVRSTSPNVEAWYSRLQKRPAFRRHVMVDFSQLSGRLAF